MKLFSTISNWVKKPPVPPSEKLQLDLRAKKTTNTAACQEIDFIKNPPFLGLTQKGMEEFSQKVRKVNGKVIILVHPWFEEGTKEQRGVINGLLAQKQVPAIILEQNRKELLQNAKTKLEALKAPNHTIILTDKGSPNQILKDGKVDASTLSEPNKNFEKMYRIIKAAGGRSVFVGGLLSTKEYREFGMDRDIERYERKRLNWKVPLGKKEYDICKCVGRTYAGLVKNAVVDEKNGNIPLNIRMIPGAIQRLPWYSQERAALHKPI